MGASTETEKLTTEDLVARLKKKLVAERKRRAKFEQQLKTGAGNRMVQAAIRMNNAATAITKNLKVFLTLKRHEKYKERRKQKHIEALAKGEAVPGKIPCCPPPALGKSARAPAPRYRLELHVLVATRCLALQRGAPNSGHRWGPGTSGSSGTSGPGWYKHGNGP